MRRLTTDEFIHRAIGVHGNKYNYDKVVYENMHTPVEIICMKHGSFFQEPSNHLKGYGCLICNKIDNRKLSVEEFIKRSNAVHNNKYDYSRVEYVNHNTPVKIICPKHVQQSPTI